MNKLRIFMVSLIGISFLFVACNNANNAAVPQSKSISPTRSTSSSSKFRHFTAGFQIINASNAQDAANLGIQVAFNYGEPYSEDSTMGRVFKSLQLEQIGGQISSLLYQYECHHLYQNHIDPQGYCSQDYPGMNYQTLMDTVKKDVINTKSHSSHSGYWILDDWPGSDEGSAKSILQSITQIIHTYDPGKPSICGFGAELGINRTDLFDPNVTKNYSPGGCDMVGIYVYSQSVTDSNTTPDTFDWSMSNLLPLIFNALQRQGWDKNKVPYIGIAQAWAGKRSDVNGFYEIVPTSQDIAEESASFCYNGALAINYYAWNTSDISDLQSPENNSQIREGVLQGIKSCQTYWNNLPT